MFNANFSNISAILVFYLKKNRMAQRHAPLDKKNRGAMYCRCALFHFFKRSVRSQMTYFVLHVHCMQVIRNSMCPRGHHGRDHMVVGFTTTYTINAFHH
jgi:hypothetical protein